MLKQEEIISIILGEIRTLIMELHSELRRQPEVELDSLLDRDLGLDSLGRVELIGRLEKRLEIRFPEQVLTTAETPRDILRAVAAGGGVSPELQLREKIQVEQTGAVDHSTRHAETMLQVVAMQANSLQERPHIFIETFTGDPETLSFSELYSESMQTAASLQQYELEPGDTVALMLPTSRQYFTAFFGILLAGGVPVPLYPPTRPSQIQEHLRRHMGILQTARAKVLITIPEVKGIGRLLQTRIDSLKAVVVAEELTAAEHTFSQISRRPGDLAFLQYTSGSTGDPKGVILTHQNLLANIRAMGEVVRVEPGDTFVSWLPLYHDMGLIGAWLGSLYFGCRLVVMSPLSFLARPDRWLWAIDRYEGTLSAAPNFGYELCCNRIADADIEGLSLGTWRMAFNGAEAVSPNTVERFIQRFTPYGFRRQSYAPVYGLAECSVGLAFPTPDRGPLIDHVGRDRFSRTGRAIPEQGANSISFVACGLPLPGHQLRVVDQDGRELPERQQGRLQFKGPSATSGYLRNPEKTKELFDGQWLDTGDLAYIADGELYITGRIKDIIIRGGRNLHPAEYEEAIGNIDGIRKGCVAVFGTQHSGEGKERVVVLAETRLKNSDRLHQLEQQIFDLGIELLGMAPDEVRLVPPGVVLKTSSGKVRRAATKNFYERGLLSKKKQPVWVQLIRIILASIPSFLGTLSKRIISYGYAGYCWAIWSVLALPALGLIMLIPSRRTAWSVAHYTARILAKCTATKIMVQGRENLRQATPSILVANHMSYLDSFVLTAAVDVPFGFVAKAELARFSLLKKVLQKLGTVFVERFDAEQSRDDAKKMSQRIGKGELLLFFAEGTLQRMPGLLPFQMGAFAAAVENNACVIPLTIRGTRSKLRSGSWFPYRGGVEVSIAAPIHPDGQDWNAAVSLRNRVREEILRVVREPDLAEEFSSLSQLHIPKPNQKKS